MSRFLSAYHAYVSKASDMPYEFAHAGALNCLSGIALGRRWIERGSGIRPNLFQMLVAGSTKDRKSTGVRLSTELLEAVDPDRVGPADFTAEALISMMRARPGQKNDRNKLVLPIEEFGQYLAATSSYGATLNATLCALYDGSDFKKARSGKKLQIIRKPRLSIFAAVAWGMLEKYSDPTDWLTGFYARFVFVCPDPAVPRHRYATTPPTPKVELQAAQIALADLRNELKQSVGAMAVLPAAEALLDQYAKSFIDVDDPVMAAQRERYLNAVWKYAILYQIDDNPAFPIGPQAMQYAILYIQKAWNAFLKVYMATAGSNFAKISNRILTLADAAGPEGVTKREVYRRHHLDPGLLRPVLDSLVAMGMIVITKRLAGPKGGRPTEFIVSTAALDQSESEGMRGVLAGAVAAANGDYGGPDEDEEDGPRDSQ